MRPFGLTFFNREAIFYYFHRQERGAAAGGGKYHIDAEGSTSRAAFITRYYDKISSYHIINLVTITY